MTDTTLPPGDDSVDRIQPVDIQQEMQRSYIDYAMSVIVGRALPEVRDGLKPVHRRVLYAMYDSGFRPDRSHAKSARSVAETMGNYHPHGDASIYDTLVRMAQPWSLRYPLVDGQGNFGSPGNDPPAAMRYCVTADALVRLPFGQSVRIGDVVPGAKPNTDNVTDLKVLDRHGNPVLADRLFHSGDHQTYTVRTAEGYEVTGTANHPLLCLVDVGGVPTLLWRLIEEIRPDDCVVMQRTPPTELGPADWEPTMEALLLGAFISEGFVSEARAGFNNLDRDFFNTVVTAYDAVVGGTRYVSERTIASGSLLYELDIHNVNALRGSRLWDVVGQRSADKAVPEWLWQAPACVKRAFLQALFEGDGSCSVLPRNTIQVSYSTRSERLAKDVQQMLLEFGVVSHRYRHAVGEHKVVITNRAQAELFAAQIGFGGAKQAKLTRILGAMPPCAGMDGDHVPGLGRFVRRHSGSRWVDKDWLNRHNVDRIQRWRTRGAEILSHIADPDVRAIATELTDGRFYYAKVASVTEAGVQPVYSLRVDTEDHAFLTNGFVSHNTEARLTPLAMEMLREIDEETVDFIPNYDGRVQEPTVLPSRFPNLLANGSGGIAVGMATNIPPHNLRELAEAVYWCLDNHEADEEATLTAVCERVKGPDFPTHGLIVGSQGIHDAYTTGRGSIRMRGVVEVEEDSRGRTSLVITELPYQVNHDNFITSIAEQVRDGKLAGISNIEDQSSDRVGLRIVVEIKRDAVAKVVLNNLYKHTQLQTSFGANMLSIVDGVPRTLRLDQMIRHYVAHQLDVIVRRTTYRLRKANERAHILRGLVKALDALDEVIALIRASETVDIARAGLIELLDIDEIQAQAILDMQLRRLAALERQRIIDDLAKIEAEIADLEDILAKPERQRRIVHDELSEIVDKHGDERRTRIIAADGDVNDEDLIAREDVVVTITETGYAKRTKTDLYRSQKRGGKGVQGAGLKQDDIVRHFFVCSTHDWILFFTTQGRVYRAKAYELPEASRTARGQHVANLLAFQPEERIAQVIQIRGYEDAPYLVLATRNGLVKKTKLTDFDSNRSGGIVAINLRDNDELVGAVLCSSDEDLLLVSANGQSIRFSATDEALRPMGRATSGVQGMRFNADDYLLSLNVVREGTYLLVATSGGYAKRTAIEEYPVQGRGGKGVLTVMYDRRRGRLVGALIVDEDSELYAITSGGGVIRTAAGQVRKAGRQTKGVRLMNLGEENTLLAIARNAEANADEAVEEVEGAESES
ncbi:MULTISPECIES: intein-containing DNA gyrase subunit A [Mycobacterium avium complex (MAC)]|uniref:intein-containing DNA gyrase subunit A n=1 Tax=Mycobacterium avium complex (MAC) TaxID=120793 RepID=UPI0001B45618|nr:MULTISPECIES: intein-containing DNA gyrase subunit A [Mycobacterium avium complex (MAC)]ASW93276.1 intein-containing DNA gyrase subunit A [Mycobacterium intracellulare]MCA2233818.1 intein-containing DNA gyrase subunit A [Mycobacterium intracellulare]MCA2246554.1 intein-containing DNA gyrase subunit A [Mycobacterium intracellulare]MEE3801822.1 intein-containing DNA gyrase subunit A [Mycobacterium intracellulare]OBG08649.1 DNA gyrase subunit A [Mycobacterium intracellulare]